MDTLSVLILSRATQILHMTCIYESGKLLVLALASEDVLLGVWE